LIESIRQFPTPERFADMISAAGFARVSCERLTGGVVAIHSGWKL
jgi:demethylmenaquinone methyltransferase/2-methoxy-6-polyprenyl-1,4-benzoquinol methylase